jgi:hypothetical protein
VHVADQHPLQWLYRGIRHRHCGSESRRVCPSHPGQRGDSHQLLVSDVSPTGELEGDVADDPAVMPPVVRPARGKGCGQAVHVPPVVHPHGQEIRRARPGQPADVELEGSVATFVFTDVDPVPPDLGEVEDRAEAQAYMGRPGDRGQRQLPTVPGDARLVDMLRHDIPGVRHCDRHPAAIIEIRLRPPPSLSYKIGVGGKLPWA